MNNPHRRLSEMLLEQQIITEDQLKIAFIEQKKNAELLDKILINLGFVSEAVIRDLKSHTLLPISFDKNTHTLSVAMADVFNILAIDQLVTSLGGNVKIEPILAGEAEIINTIDLWYGFELSIDGILNEIETGEVDYQSLTTSDDDEYSQPFVRLVDALISDAVKRGASDIHFEPEKGFLRVRYRIDGVLRQIRSLHKSYWSAIAVRLKVMAALNIAETRLAQDGRISLTLVGRSIDFRVSVQPTVYGENIVLRILDSQKGIMALKQLGLLEDNLITLKLMIARPEGVILITGPTGSGKTTTLYSLLQHLNTEEVNIMTLEDPIILVGEIRDHETAEMAFRAAMTGHQVYSTLHTNSAIGAIPRLLDIGVLPDIMAENTIGIVGQRLVRKLCLSCKQAYLPNEIHRKLLNLVSTEKVTLFRPNQCEQCGQRGYKGRLALMEICRIEESLQDRIAHRATTYDIKKHANKMGFRTLAQEGVRRILEGISSLEEVSRVVDLTTGF